MIFNPMAWPLAAKIGGILGVAVLGGVTATAAISSSGTPGEPEECGRGDLNPHGVATNRT